MNIKGYLACEYCHTKAFRTCSQKDDMQKVYPVLDEADMIVLASPIYYHGFSGQLQCAINRIYAPGFPKKLKKAALLLSSGDKGVYDGAIFAYQNSFIEYLHLENMGIFTAAGSENKSEEMLTRLTAAGAALTDPDDHNVARLVITAGDVTVKAKLKQRCILIRVDRKGIGLLSLISGSMPFSIYGCISFRWPGPWNRGSTSAVW